MAGLAANGCHRFGVPPKHEMAHVFDSIRATHSLNEILKAVNVLLNHLHPKPIGTKTLCSSHLLKQLGKEGLLLGVGDNGIDLV